MASSLSNTDVPRPGGSTFRLGAPPSLGDDEVRTLEAAVRVASRDLSEVWSTALNAECTVEVTSVEIGDVASLEELAPARSASTLATITGLPGQLLVIVPIEMGLIAVDLMLGGRGRPPSGEHVLSAIDADLLNALVTPTLEALADALRDDHTGAGSHPQSPNVATSESATDATKLDLGAFDETGAIVRLTTHCGESSATWSFVLTAAMAHALVGTTATSTTGGDDEVATFQAAVQRRLVTVPLHAIVEFPPVRMRSTDLISLRVDDVIALDCPIDGWLRVVVDGETIANARAARSGDRLACQIVATPAHPASPEPMTTTSTTEFSPAGARRADERQGAS